MPGLTEVRPDGSRHDWDGLTATFTEYAANGSVVLTRPFTAAEAVAYPPVDPAAATPDLPTLADQITVLTDAVNLLILNSLGV